MHDLTGGDGAGSHRRLFAECLTIHRGRRTESSPAPIGRSTGVSLRRMDFDECADPLRAGAWLAAALSGQVVFARQPSHRACRGDSAHNCHYCAGGKAFRRATGRPSSGCARSRRRCAGTICQALDARHIDHLRSPSHRGRRGIYGAYDLYQVADLGLQSAALKLHGDVCDLVNQDELAILKRQDARYLGE